MKKNKTRDDLYMEDVPQNTKATVRRLLSRLGRQKGRLLVVTTATLLSSAAYARPSPCMWAWRWITFSPCCAAAHPPNRSLNPAAGALFLPVLLLLAASAASSLLAYVQQYVIASVGEELTLSLRQDISRKLGRLPLRYFDSHKTGDILSRITNDLEKVSSVMQVGLMQLISSAFTILLTCVIMLILSPLLFLVTLVSVLVCAVATKYVSRWSQRCYAENMAAMGALSAKVEELYAGNRVIKVFSRQEEAVGEVSALNQAQFEANRRAQFADFAIYPSIRLLNQLGFVAVAVAGGLSALAGGMTLGGVLAFLQYVNQISEPVTQASYVITSLQAAIAGAERVFALLDEEEERPDPAGLPAPLTEGRVAFRGVRFGYTPDRLLMRDVNLEVRPGDMVAIVGPTGGGKTTLINLLMRFYELEWRRDRGRRAGHLRPAAGRAAPPYRHGAAGYLAVRGHGGGEHRLRRMDAIREEIVAAARARLLRSLHPHPAGGLRHRHFRRGLPPVSGPDAAAHHRPRHADRPRHPDPRRSHLQRGHPHRGGDPKGHDPPDEGQDQLRHRPPALYHPQRGSHPGGAGRRYRRAWQPRNALSKAGLLRLPVQQPVRSRGIKGRLPCRPANAPWEKGPVRLSDAPAFSCRLVPFPPRYGHRQPDDQQYQRRRQQADEGQPVAGDAAVDAVVQQPALPMEIGGKGDAGRPRPRQRGGQPGAARQGNRGQ